MKYRFLRAARDELDAAIDWYEARSVTAAPKLIASVYSVVRTICELPEAGERWPSRNDVRRFPVAGFPFLVVYFVEPDEIMVVAVAHAKRRPGYWLGRIRTQ